MVNAMSFRGRDKIGREVERVDEGSPLEEEVGGVDWDRRAIRRLEEA